MYFSYFLIMSPFIYTLDKFIAANENTLKQNSAMCEFYVLHIKIFGMEYFF